MKKNNNLIVINKQNSFKKYKQIFIMKTKIYHCLFIYYKIFLFQEKKKQQIDNNFNILF